MDGEWFYLHDGAIGPLGPVDRGERPMRLARRGARLESVTNLRLFASPYETGQPKLFALSALGEGGWLKAMRMKGYAPRSPGRPKALQQALFRYAEAL